MERTGTKTQDKGAYITNEGSEHPWGVNDLRRKARDNDNVAWNFKQGPL